jgi:GAF domain-containing protein
MRPLGKLTLESDRLRGRIEAIERLAAESRVAAEAQRADEQRMEEELALFYAVVEAMDALPERAPLLSAFFTDLPRALQAARVLVLMYDAASREFEVVFEARAEPAADGDAKAAVGARLPWGVGLASAVVGRRVPLRTSTYAETCRQERVAPSPLAAAGLPHSIGVPLGGADPVGVLVVWSAHRPFTRDDERFLRGVAPLLAAALRRG